MEVISSDDQHCGTMDEHHDKNIPTCRHGFRKYTNTNMLASLTCNHYTAQNWDMLFLANVPSMV